MSSIKEIRTKFLQEKIINLFCRGTISESIREIDNFAKRKILVLAPHTDDEVIGCGGLIKKFSSSSSNVYVLFVTVEDERAIVKPTYIKGKNKRIIESENAKKYLNYTSQFYLEIPERNIEHNAQFKNEITNTILNLLYKYEIDTMLIPNFYDMNPDHRIISKIGLTAIPNGYLLKSIFLYEVWGPVNATHACLLNKKEFDNKINAMKCYETQLSSVDYFNIINLISSIRLKDYSLLYPESIKKLLPYSIEFYECIEQSNISNYLKKNLAI